ncbi:BMP family lipoprotein [Thermohalobacter berrensis]|uniref:BMP family ABC transporter substrate-binding protein n=1 Tax=Thermohalobacter berrensis TaxID=99594 RepID=A0A419SV68_9FIRM|nr:BMP family ABC transporter substrate-binding protein [Thermohalobacter berrensis]RKD29107.1 BMP family ABC transporter substrate-binding protein [Thermohalobacter berrensis]
MFKKVLSLLMVSVFILTLAVGCGAGGQNDTGENEDKVKIAMVTDVGGVNDQSFNQSAWEGLQRAEEELGIEVSYLESNQDADYIPNLETLLDANNDLIWGIGYKMGNAILEAAKQNPDQKYAIIDYAYEDTPDNLVGVVFKAEQPSFLVGYIAGKMTETGKVGFVGGIKSAVIDGFDYGFHAGVKYANPDVEIIRQYAESFTDSAKGKAIATNMFQNGADIVFHAAGAVGDGVIEAAKEQGKYAIGVDRDQNYLAPDNVITSAMKRVDNAMFNMAKELKEGNFPGGQTVVYGLKEGGVDIAPTTSKHVPADILEEVEELKQKIIDGEIVVPFNEETYNEFISENIK